jgi:hypothetical protein
MATPRAAINLGTWVPNPEIGAAFTRALLIAALGLGAWWVLWGLGLVVTIAAQDWIVWTWEVLCGRPPRLDPEMSGWYVAGHYAQIAFGVVTMIVAWTTFVRSRMRVVVGGLWFALALLLAVAGYFSFYESVRIVLIGATPIGAAWYWFAAVARRRAP